MVYVLENASALIVVDDISCYNRKKKKPMNEQKRRDYIKKERMANQFAIDILMPKKLILLALEHVKKTEPPSRKYYEAEKIKRARIVDILLDEIDYIVTDEEVKQAFKNRGFINLKGNRPS